MFSHIVVPLDGSPEGNVAVAHASLLARLCDATVTLLRVVSSGRDVPAAQALLEGLARDYATPNVSMNVVVREGDAPTRILEEVQQRGADLVVMRTHGRSGLTRMVLGSVAERIVKHSPTPVLLLAPHGQADRPVSIDSILVALDGSPGSTLALGAARELARRSGARLHLLQVLKPLPAYQSSALLMNGPMYVDASWDEDAEAGARAYVEALASRLTAQGLAAQGEALVANSVPDAIITNAGEHACDLIVMSSHAHTGAARAFLGSVTDAVVRAAARPVLVIRREAEAETAAEEAAAAEEGDSSARTTRDQAHGG
jgi:nucleotide-binding universal stress UspA family protein